MSCPKCQVDPEYHSFTNFGSLEDGGRIFYTAPARAKEDGPYEQFITNFKLHLETAKDSRWIWIFDCEQMKQSYGLGFLRDLANVLHKDHDLALEAIYLIRPNFLVYTLIKTMQYLLRSDVLKKVHILSETNLALFYKFETLGISGNALHWLTEVLKVPVTAPLPKITYI